MLVLGTMLLNQVGSIFRELGEGSSLHGLPKVISSKQVAIKIFWAIIVVGASILLGLQLKALYEEFTRYPTKTSIKVEYGPIEFPAVTVCNMNPMKLSKIGYFPNASFFLDIIRANAESTIRNDDIANNDISNESHNRTESSTNRNSQNRKTQRPERRPNSTTESSNPDERPSGNSIDTDVPEILASNDWHTTRKRFLIALREAKQSLRVLHGHVKNHLILSAMFNQEALPPSFVEPVLSGEHGICYTINVDDIAESAGTKAGLRAVLFLDKGEYLEEIMDGYGIKVIVHERGTFPMPSEEGYELNPGHQTDVGITRKTIERYGYPYGNCIDGHDFKNKNGVEYSIPVCVALCRLQMTWTKCGCVPYLAPELIGIHKDRTVCQWRNDCVESISNIIKENPKSCNCLGKCHQHVYESRFTNKLWPNPTYLQNIIYANACSKGISSLNNTCEELRLKRLNFTDANFKEYSENFVGLRIFYETLVYETVVEEPLYTTISFLSDVGGSMSFFLGASLITYLELVHLLVELLICCCKHYSRKRASVCPVKKDTESDILETKIPI